MFVVQLVTYILVNETHVLTWNTYPLMPFVSVLPDQISVTFHVFNPDPLAGLSNVIVLGAVVSVVKFHVLLRNHVLLRLLYAIILR